MRSDRTITVSLDAAHAAIADSVRAVLRAHGYLVGMVDAVPGYPYAVVTPLDPDVLEALFDEVGRNTAQSLMALDVAREFDEDM